MPERTSPPPRVVFLDRDGTIIEEPPDQQVDSLEKLLLVPGAIRGLRLLREAGYELVMVTNQDNLGRPSYPTASFEQTQARLLEILDREGVRFLDIFVCPHAESDGCTCRKPKTGLVEPFLSDAQPDRAQSFMVGDRETDVTFGRAISVRSIRIVRSASEGTSAEVRVGTFAEACEHILRRARSATVRRTTSETDISVDIAIDGTGSFSVRTGLGFFDHMLSLLIKHAAMDAAIDVGGDLHVDEHHTVEDTGLVLGEAIRKALGTPTGIERFGFIVPMDEAQARVALDLSGRPFLRFDAAFTRERVGDMPTELFEDFFRALADGLRATLHISAEGRNDHHIAEACFKAVGRCIRQAVYRRDDLRNILPSTKGVL